MTSKIFRSILSAAIFVLLASLVIITGVLHQYFGNMQQDFLKDELSLAASGAEQLGISYLERLGAERYRLTWIDSDGTVLFDSHADAPSMENHADREEVREALVSGVGSSTRHSATLTEKTIYEATRLEDGSVLRISVSSASALNLVLGMLRPIAVVALIAAAFSALLARRMARRVVNPLNSLDLERPMENEAYEELSPLLHRIHAQQLELDARVRKLRQRQEEFDQITGSMKEALVLLDGSGMILSINPAARELFSAGADCIGEDLLALDRSHDMRLALDKVRAQGHSAFRSGKGGREYQFDLSRIDSGDNMQGVVILAFDITERVNAERNRQEFTANVSHELKTPLQTIIGSAELMENGIVKPEDMPRFLAHIRKEAQRLLCLIEDILRLSQLDEGLEMPREQLSLRALSEQVCEALSDAAGLKELSLRVSGDEGIIKGVRGLLYELIYNLCDNAIKYNRPGGMAEISITDTPGSVRLRVHDTGIGIAPEHHEKIFERFYRVDKSHSKKSGGTGLGLAIVKHAVLLHGGKLELESEVGKGTTISVIFDTSVI